VATDELSQSTREAKRVPGPHFIGEVVDVTGCLGGANFDCAGSFGWAAGRVIDAGARARPARPASLLRPAQTCSA
jgi:predicted flavoprotein YhiN